MSNPNIPSAWGDVERVLTEDPEALKGRIEVLRKIVAYVTAAIDELPDELVEFMDWSIDPDESTYSLIFFHLRSFLNANDPVDDIYLCVRWENAEKEALTYDAFKNKYCSDQEVLPLGTDGPTQDDMVAALVQNKMQELGFICMTTIARDYCQKIEMRLRWFTA